MKKKRVETLRYPVTRGVRDKLGCTSRWARCRLPNNRAARCLGCCQSDAAGELVASTIGSRYFIYASTSDKISEMFASAPLARRLSVQPYGPTQQES